MNDKLTVFNIQLNIDQINVILATLGKLPYETIAQLMTNIQTQATQQLQQLQSRADAAAGVENSPQSNPLQ